MSGSHPHRAVRAVRTALALAAATMVAAGLGACAFLGPVERFHDEATISEAITEVRLVDTVGSVTVRGVEGAEEISVERDVSYRGKRPEGATHTVDGDTLELRGCGRRCSVDYTLEVPVGLDVRGSTENGAIELSAVAEVEVETSNGRIELEQVSGTVDAETSNGRIIGRELNGDGIRASTSNGGIELEVIEPQDVEATTSNGSIELTVPPGSYRVSTETSNGGTEVGIADDPGAEHTLTLRTSNGSITVREE